MRLKLTARIIATLKPKRTTYEATDDTLQGFAVRVWPSGKRVYVLRYRLRNGRQRRVTIGNVEAVTLAQARDLARGFLGDVVQGEDPAQGRRDARAARVNTLAAFLDTKYGPWVLAHRKAGRNTLDRLRSAFADLLDKPLKEITTWHVEKWRSAFVKAHKGDKAAGNRHIACLKAALSKAVEWNVLQENPLSKVKLAKTDRRKPMRTLSPEEEVLLWAAVDAREEELRTARDRGNAWRRVRGYRERQDLRTVAYADCIRPLLVVLLNTGIRRGEAFSLEWQDVDLDKREIVIHGLKAKSGQTREVPLNDEALAALTAWGEQTTGKGLVFPSTQKPGERLDNIATTWRGLTRAAGVAGLRLHDLRHTFASRLMASGADLQTVREILGHASITTTSIYLHSTGDRKREAVRQMAQAARDTNNVIAFKNGGAK